MPNYDFRCDACTAEFEVSRPLSAAREPAHCPACGEPARRVFSP
ncbi:MAG: zinc ribbon domain-containing protein, partial [Chloroflexi bacterium]|nr:zinc ribbon domain-containing protein [Chloroflexota bacterium]